MIIIAQCVRCKEQREIDNAESKRLTLSYSVPLCENCGVPMIALRAKVIGGEQAEATE